MKNEDAVSFSYEEDLLDTGLPPTRTAMDRIHQACVKLHQQLAPLSFALLHSLVLQTFSSLSTTEKSAPFSAR
jgi:hypothetical protein